MGLNDVIQLASQAAAESLISCVWQGILLTSALWVCLKLTPKTTSAIRFKVWAAAFVVLALLPLLRFFTISHGSSHAIVSGAVEASAANAGLFALQLDARWALCFAAIWLLASALRAASLIRNVIKLRALWRRSTPVEAPASLLADEGSRRVQLCTSPDLDQPSAIGFFSPRVLIPDWLFETLKRDELEQIALHEIEHLRRGDDWINLIQKIVLVLFPLNPALAWVERRLCAERELACDEAVLRTTHAPREYATCLTSLAEKRMQRRAVAALSLGAWDKESELSRRVHAILGSGATMNPGAARAVLAVLVLASSGAGFVLAGSPTIVSFKTKQDAVLSGAAQVGGPVGVQQFDVIGQAAKYKTVRFDAAQSPGAKFQDAVFHPSATPKPAITKHATFHKTTHAAMQPVLSQQERTEDPLMPRADAIARNGDVAPVQHATVIVFTQWEVTLQEGSIVNLVDDNPRNSPHAVARIQGGWIVIQL